MASALKFLIISAIIVCCAEAELSKHDINVLLSISVDLKDMSKNCLGAFASFTNNTTTDSQVDDFCNQIKNTSIQNTTFISEGCQGSDLKKTVDVTCEQVMDSKKNRDAWLSKYAKIFNNLSGACKNETGPIKDVKTWYDIETLCETISTKNKAAFEASCSKENEYADLKAVVCGSGSAIVCGLVTLGLCLVASLFNKL